MNTETQKQIELKFVKKLPEFNVGDTIAVTTIIREGDKQRTQTFKGVVLAIKGDGLRKSFTVRKISAGVGVEKIIPFNSPNIEKLVVLKRGEVRSSKIYYMRKRIGKKALKVSEKSGLYDLESDEVVEDTQAEEAVAEATANEEQS
jgi:large subunit ribosomal protein L19